MAGYEYNAFYEKKKEELKKEYIEKNKRLLQEEVAMEVKRINNIISDFYFSVFSILDNRVHMIESLIHSQIKTHQYLKNKQLNKHIFDTINSLNYSNADNYDFIFNEQGEILFHSLEKRLEGLNILESSEFAPELKNSVKKVIKDGEASAGYVFVRNGVKRKIYTDMKKVNDFFIASCVYIDNLEAELQKNIFKSLEYSRLGVDRKGYFWVTNSENVMLFHPFQKELISKNLTELKTKNGVAIFKEVDKLLQDKDEAFLTYDWQVPDTDEYAEKIAYVKKIPKWD
jgi:signal transduction histidine kinase